MRGLLVVVILLCAIVLPNLPGTDNPTVPSRPAGAFSTSSPAAVAARATKPYVVIASSPVPVYHATRRLEMHAGPGRALSILHSLRVHQPVVFITIDDGYTRDARVLGFLRRTHLPVTLFLVDDAAQRGPGYFRALQSAGAVIENHTKLHPHLRRLRYRQQKAQICTPEWRDRRMFGRAPALFRPPYGEYDLRTQQAAKACGMRALVLWRAAYVKGRLHTIGGLRAGDIVLLHFNTYLFADLNDLVARLHRAHLGVGLLEDYLDVGARIPPPQPKPLPSPSSSPSPTPSASPLLSPLPSPS